MKMLKVCNALATYYIGHMNHPAPLPVFKLLILFCVLNMIISLSSCHNTTSKKHIHTIGLKPIGNYNPQQLQFIRQQVHDFYNVPVVILDETTMPASFMNTTKGERYSADSILRWLPRITNDSVSYVIGLTHKDIFTTITDNIGRVKEPAYKYAVWGIFGYGYCPGRSAVMSDFRLKTNDTKKFQHRLRTVVIHEIGHNLGLTHCPQTQCIMNDANEKIQTVDNSANVFCAGCRKKTQ
jgi:archaemetzincin